MEELDKGPVIRDTLLTTSALVTGMIGALLGYRLANEHYGARGLGQYSLLLQLTAITASILNLGLAVAIARYVAMAEGQRRPRRAKRYWLAGLVVGIFVSMAALLSLNLKPGLLAAVALGGPEQAWGILPATLLAASLVLATQTASYYRGHLRIGIASLINMLIVGVTPVLAFGVPAANTLADVLLWRSLLNLAVACVFSLPVLKFLLYETPSIRKEAKEIVRYGAARMPAELAINGLQSLGPLAATHLTSLTVAGYLALGMRLTGMVRAALAPLGTVLLPRISRSLARNEPWVVGSRLGSLVSASLDVSIFVCAQLMIHLDFLIAFWFDDSMVVAVQVIRPIMLIIPFAAMYVALRSWLDAITVKALNTLNVILALVVLTVSLGIIWLLSDIIPALPAIEFSIILSWAVLGVATTLMTSRLYRMRLPSPFWPLLVSLAMTLPWAFVDKPKVATLPGLVLIAAVSVLSFVLFMISMHLCGRRWPTSLLEAVRLFYHRLATVLNI